MFCISCGAKNTVEAKFCSNCGKEIAPSPASTSENVKAEPVSNAKQPEQAKTPDSSNQAFSLAATLEGLSSLIVGLFFLAIAGYFFWGFLTSIFDGKTEKELSPPAMLEKVTVIGQTKRSDYQHFIDEGGVPKNPAWHGFYVEEVQFNFDRNEILMGVSLKISSLVRWLDGIKSWHRSGEVTPKEIRQRLSELCGVVETNWKIDEMVGMARRERHGDVLLCAYRVNRSNEIVVFMGWEP